MSSDRARSRNPAVSAAGSLRSFALKVICAGRFLLRDERIPRPIRWLGGFALLPIPGPLDELFLLLIAPILALFYRRPMRDAWARAEL